MPTKSSQNANFRRQSEENKRQRNQRDHMKEEKPKNKNYKCLKGLHEGENDSVYLDRYGRQATSLEDRP